MKKAKLLAQVKGRSQCSEDVGLLPGVTKGYVYNSKKFTVIPTKFQGCTMILHDWFFLLSVYLPAS